MQPQPEANPADGSWWDGCPLPVNAAICQTALIHFSHNHCGFGSFSHLLFVSLLRWLRPLLASAVAPQAVPPPPVAVDKENADGAAAPAIIRELCSHEASAGGFYDDLGELDAQVSPCQSHEPSFIRHSSPSRGSDD